MLTITHAPGDAALAARLKADLQAAGYAADGAAQTGEKNLLLAVLSPQANTDAGVLAALADALDRGQPILPVLAQAGPLPKLIDHLPVLDFSEAYDADALRQSAAALLAPGAGRPLKVATPKVQRRNRRFGLWLGALALVWFITALILVGVFGAQAPLEEFNADATIAAVTVQYAIGLNLPRTTQEALDFPLTVQAVPTAQRPLLIATATALIENQRR